MENKFRKPSPKNPTPIDWDHLQTAMRVISQYQRQIRAVAAATGFLAILAPWVPLGPDRSMNGGELMAHVLTGGETWAWMTSGNILGFILMVTFPFYMIPTLIMAFIGHLKGMHTPISNIVILVAPPITMAVASYPMLDESPSRIMGLAMPLWGLQVAMLAHASLLIHTAYLDVSARWLRARNQQKLERAQRLDMEYRQERQNAQEAQASRNNRQESQAPRANSEMGLLRNRSRNQKPEGPKPDQETN